MHKIQPYFIYNYPSPEFLIKSSSRLGLVIEKIKLFYVFNKTYKFKKHLFYFQDEKEFYKCNKEAINFMNKINVLIELIQIKNDSFNFKLRNNNIKLRKLICDEESDLISHFCGTDNTLDYWSFPVHNFLLNYFNKTNNKAFNVFSYSFGYEKTIEFNILSELLYYLAPIFSFFILFMVLFFLIFY